MPDIDDMWEAESARIWEELNDDSGQCCKYCYHFNSPFCTYYDGQDDCPEKEDTDWCEHFQQESFAPDWEDF